jgi:hypothetical protein
MRLLLGSTRNREPHASYHPSRQHRTSLILRRIENLPGAPARALAIRLFVRVFNNLA